MGKKRRKKKVLLSGSDPFYLSKKLRRRRYGEVSAQTSQKSQNRALVKKKVAYRAPAAQACTPPTWTINRIFSKSKILAESLNKNGKKKKKICAHILLCAYILSPVFTLLNVGCISIFWFKVPNSPRRNCSPRCSFNPVLFGPQIPKNIFF